MRYSTIFVAIAALLAASPAFAGNRLFIEPMTVEAGATGVEAVVRAEHDQAITGYSVAIDYDPAVVQVSGIFPTEISESADFFEGCFGDSGSCSAGRIVWGVVLDFSAVQSLPPSLDDSLLRIGFDVISSQATCTQIAFRDERFADPSKPSELNVLVDTSGISIPGLATSDGDVTVESAAGTVFRLDKAVGKLGRRGWVVKLARMAFDPGTAFYDLDGSEIRVVLDGNEFFAPETLLREPKIKRNRRTGETVKIVLKDVNRNVFSLNLKRRILKVVLKNIPESQFTPVSGGTVNLEVRYDNRAAIVDVPVALVGRRLNKLVVDPPKVAVVGAFLPAPGATPCE